MWQFCWLIPLSFLYVPEMFFNLAQKLACIKTPFLITNRSVSNNDSNLLICLWQGTFDPRLLQLSNIVFPTMSRCTSCFHWFYPQREIGKFWLHALRPRLGLISLCRFQICSIPKSDSNTSSIDYFKQAVQRCCCG